MINSIDFSKKPEKIIPYQFGDTITRENFINFLILSYALSRGNFVIQKVFFILMEKKVNFPYKNVVENLYKNGSFGAFSKEEQKIFLDAFYKTKRHAEKFEEFEMLDEIKSDIDGFYERQEDDGLIALHNALIFFDSDKINSTADFIKTATEFNKRFEDSLN